MGFEAPTRRVVAILLSGLMLTLFGGLMVVAWQNGMLGSMLGLGLGTGWLIGAIGWAAARTPLLPPAPAPADMAPRGPPLHALFDQIPLPLLRIEGRSARALNRAGRMLFATDDRLSSPPPALFEPQESRLRHEGRSWRIERVEAGPERALAMLIDVEAERRTAEAHADSEMIDILGHELLNGLSPIVSLADSAVMAAERQDARLHGILATLARRIEGLERFTRAYRTLARLPDPVRNPFKVAELAVDLARLFEQRFGSGVALSMAVPDGLIGRCDRDQMTQALWALLQNAAEAALGGAVTPQVTLTAAMDGPSLRFAITDSGGGVAGPERARIFRPFHTTKPDGSGIGLTLARRIARAHGGDLTLLPVATTTFALAIPGE